MIGSPFALAHRMRIATGVLKGSLLTLVVVLGAGCGKTKQAANGARAGANPEPAATAEKTAAPAAPAPAPDPAALAAKVTDSAAKPSPIPVAIVLPRGTALLVRLDQEVDTKRNRPGDRFSATLSEPVMKNGAFVLPAGTRCYGRVTLAKPSGRLKGHAELALRLDAVDWNGRRYEIHTASILGSGKHKRRNIAAIGGGAGAGAVVGGAAGGGVGAAVGAVAGAGAGVVGAAFTGRKQVVLRAETPIAFTLHFPLTL